MRTTIKRTLACIGLAAFAAVAIGMALPPQARLAGRSQADWSVRWWKWVLNTTASQDPTTDTTGAAAGGGDQGGVFFLAGANTSDPVHRSVTIPEGRFLFFPLVCAIADNTQPITDPLTPPTHFTAAELATWYGPALDGATNLHCVLDGVPMHANLGNHRQFAVFSYTITAADNYINRTGYDATLGTGTYPSTVSPAVADGYWVALSPLTPGVHTLSFGAYIPAFDFGQDITYTITVVRRGHGDHCHGSGGD